MAHRTPAARSARSARRTAPSQAAAPARPSSDPRVESLRPYLEGVAKKVAQDLFGDRGPRWGTPLARLEDLAIQARTIFAEKFLALSLERQADTPTHERPEEFRTCPGCRRPLGAESSESSEPRPQPRTVQTRAGEAVWSEPEHSCTRCRRAFFPSEQEPGH